MRLDTRGRKAVKDIGTATDLINSAWAPAAFENPPGSWKGAWTSPASITTNAAIGQLFLQGIGTRKLKSLTKDLFGAPVSAGTVSNVVSTLDADLQAYPSKPLSDDIVFLFLDGASRKVQEIGVEGKGMLGAFGIHADGTKELLSFRLTEVEDTENGRGFLVDLKGQALKRIIVNGNAALLRALREIHPPPAHPEMYRPQAAECGGEAEKGATPRLHGGGPIDLFRPLSGRGDPAL